MGQTSPANGVQARAWGPPHAWVGGLSGVLVVVAFAVVHDVLIVDIWFNIGPMVFSGALCGASLVWSYNATVSEHSERAWFGYVTVCGALLVALGAASLLGMEQRFTMAEMIDDPDAFGRLLPPALPWIGGAAVLNAAVLWVWHGRKPNAVVPLLGSQVLLVFLVGHQFAMLGLVEMSSQVLVTFAEFIGLTVFLAGGFAFAVRLIPPRIVGRSRRSAPPGPTRPAAVDADVSEQPRESIRPDGLRRG